jgi:hypothetical protein
MPSKASQVSYSNNQPGQIISLASRIARGCSPLETYLAHSLGRTGVKRGEGAKENIIVIVGQTCLHVTDMEPVVVHPVTGL